MKDDSQLLTVFDSVAKAVKKQSINYLLQQCAFCKQEMLLVKGSITYDGKWYHENCFNCIPNYCKKHHGVMMR